MLINSETIIKDNNPLIREKSLDVKVPLSKEDRALLMEMIEHVISPESFEALKKKFS